MKFGLTFLRRASHVEVPTLSSLLHQRQSSNYSIPSIEGSIRQNGTGISVGDHAQIKRSFTIDEVKYYGQLIGDYNPIHLIDGGYCDSNNHPYEPKNVIVHGMFTSSLFSSIFGTLIPGSIYRSQQLNFLCPVYTNETIIAKVEVVRVKDLRKGLLVTCDTFVYRNVNAGKQETESKLKKCVKGLAEVWIPKS